MVRYAVERQLMVIGKAANHISEKFQHEHPEIPWCQMVGQRNVLPTNMGTSMLNAYGVLQQSIFLQC
jgi:uncharacterized protein with HEPN domain